MQTKFKVHFKNRELGPLTEAQIRKMLDSKQLGLTDKYHDEEKQDWIPLAEKFGPQKEAVAVAPVPAPAPKPSAPPAALAQAAAPKVEAPTPKIETPAPKVEAPAPVKVEAAKKSAPQFEVMEVSDDTIPVPVSPELKAISKPAEPAVAHSGKVEMSGGSAMISFKQMKAGSFSLKLKSGSGLDLPTELSVVIQSAPASQIHLEGAKECKAGEEISFELKALDSFENLATDFQGSFEVHLEGSQSETCMANFEKGCSTVKFKPTKAGSCSVRVKDSSKDRLALPIPWEVKVHPNVPVKLIAEAPSEARAGEEIALKVTALDAFGNIVTDFDGHIDLEVEALPKAG